MQTTSTPSNATAPSQPGSDDITALLEKAMEARERTELGALLLEEAEAMAARAEPDSTAKEPPSSPASPDAEKDTHLSAYHRQRNKDCIRWVRENSSKSLKECIERQRKFMA